MVRRGAFFRYGFGCPDRCVGFSRLPSMNAPFPLPPLVDDLSLAYRLCPARGRQSALAVLLHGVGANEGSLAGLVPLLPDWLPVSAYGNRLYAVRPYSAHVPKAVHVFVAYLREVLKDGFRVGEG